MSRKNTSYLLVHTYVALKRDVQVCVNRSNLMINEAQMRVGGLGGLDPPESEIP